MGLSNDLSCEAGSFSCCCPNPTGIFNQRFEALFPQRWSPGLLDLLCSPLFVLVYLCTNVGLQGLPVVRLPAPFVPHSASLGPATATRVLSTRCPSLPLLLVWMNVYFLFPWFWTSLPFHFLSVLVVRGGAVCIPTPPSWFSGPPFFSCTICFQTINSQSYSLELHTCHVLNIKSTKQTSKQNIMRH